MCHKLLTINDLRRGAAALRKSLTINNLRRAKKTSPKAFFFAIKLDSHRQRSTLISMNYDNRVEESPLRMKFASILEAFYAAYGEEAVEDAIFYGGLLGLLEADASDPEDAIQYAWNCI